MATFIGMTTNDSWTGDGSDDYANGQGGNDTLVGGNGIDTLIGGDGNDVLWQGLEGGGDDGAGDLLFGGAGDDILYGEYGDTLYGGLGADQFIGNDLSIDYSDASAAVGVNTMTGGFAGEATGDTFSGSIRSIRLSNHSDVLVTALAGDNAYIRAGGGDDWVINLGTGNATLFGEDGNDRITGGAGDELLDGGDGIDTLDYANATAAITVDLSANTATGVGMGSDTVISFEQVQGSAFGDFLTGSAGNDFLFGNAGDDMIEGGLGDDALSGGDGYDTVSYASATAAVQASLAIVGEQDTGAGVDIFYGVEALIGSDFDDELTGDAGDNELSGGAGADVLVGGEGDDLLDGGLGADILVGGAGEDMVSYRDATGAVRINLSTGVHTGVGGDTFSSIEVFELGTNADNFTGLAAGETVYGFEGNDVMSGMAGDDTLVGGIGDDSLIGGDGADDLLGEAGNDRLDGGLGADSLSGGLGDDYLHGRDGNDILDGGAGADTLVGGAGLDVANYRLASSAISLNLQTGVHTGDAAGDTFNSIEYFTLSNFADSFFGSTGNDNVRGMAGDDVLIGNLGHDGLNGGAGSDILNGGDGRDILNGDAGNDTLTGGAHADAFWFSQGNFGADVVTDFQDGMDTIRVTGIAGVDDFSDLSVSANGDGWAVITFPDGSTVTLEGTTTAQVDASDFSWT